MRTVRPAALNGGSFDDEVTESLGSAFDLAVERLRPVGWDCERTRDGVAKCIVTRARQGERDVAALADYALRAIGFHVLEVAEPRLPALLANGVAPETRHIGTVEGGTVRSVR